MESWGQVFRPSVWRLQSHLRQEGWEGWRRSGSGILLLEHLSTGILQRLCASWSLRIGWSGDWAVVYRWMLMVKGGEDFEVEQDRTRRTKVYQDIFMGVWRQGDAFERKDEASWRKGGCSRATQRHASGAFEVFRLGREWLMARVGEKVALWEEEKGFKSDAKQKWSWLRILKRSKWSVKDSEGGIGLKRRERERESRKLAVLAVVTVVKSWSVFCGRAGLGVSARIVPETGAAIRVQPTSWL